AFSWPLCIYVGALLLIFPRPQPGQDSSRAAPGRLHIAAAVLLTGLSLVGLKLALRQPPTVANTNVQPQHLQLLPAWLNLSLILSLGYLSLGGFFLLNSRPLFQWSTLVSRQRLLAAAGVLLLLATIRLVQHGLASSESFVSLTVFLRQTAYTALSRPGVFLV